MNDDQLDDLKQFIDSWVSQAEARFDDRLSETEAKLERQVKDLHTEMHDGFAGVGEAIEQLHTS